MDLSKWCSCTIVKVKICDPFNVIAHSAYLKNMLINQLLLKPFESLVSLGLTELALMESAPKKHFWKFSMQVIAVVV